MIPTIKHSGERKKMDIIKTQCFPEVMGAGEMSRQSTENLEGSETTLFNTILVDTCH